MRQVRFCHLMIIRVKYRILFPGGRVGDQSIKKPIEKVQDVAQQAAHAETATAPVRRRRASLFEFILWLITTAFAVLMVLVKALPSIELDLQITRSIQLTHSPVVALLMNIISWPGFSPQAFILSVLMVILIYIFGLHWEAVVALLAAVFSTAVNILVKDLVQRPRPSPDQVNVFAVLQSYSFPSGHVMFYLGFFGFLWFLVYSLLKPSLDVPCCWCSGRPGHPGWRIPHLPGSALGQRCTWGPICWEP